ncbi:GNAT family N-acetyltransferase [Sphingomonas sp. SUN039]|nr:GNAT family N-acetyltransferase [Sphingomonas sp. SUN039]
MRPSTRIIEDDLSGPEIGALLGYHLEQMHRNSPPGSVYAFDIDRLRSADVTFWTAWDDGMLLGCGAMKDLGDGTGEVKSMRTAPDHLRKGIAAALLDHIIGVARLRGYRRLSLETGSGVAFDPALALYRRRGFTDGAAFGGYERSEFNQFLHLEL